nr:uncharacterized protein LOC113840747 isoform X4 [Anas platyrhynchos]
MRASGCGPGSDGHRKLTAQPPAEPQASAPLALAQSKAETRSRRCFPKAAPKKMLGQAPWARLSPSGPAVLLLALCTGVTTQDICSSPGFQVHGGNDQTPVLYLNASSAKEGERVLLQCILDEQFPPTRVVFCKNGLEEFSLKAQQGRLIYALVLNITSRSAGMYTCGYQQRNESNWVRNSALSAPWTLSVAGASAGETITDIQSSTGACRGRCPRHQHIDRPQMEDTSNGEVQCEYYLLPWGKPHAPLTMVTPAYAFPMQSHHFISHWDIQNPCPFIKTRFLSSTSCPASSLHAECVRLHKGHGSIPVLPGTKPICLGDPSTPAPASGSISPASASAFVLSSVSCQRNFCSEKQKAPRSNERCGSLPWWGKHFIVCSETTSSTKERMLWLGDRL